MKRIVALLLAVVLVLGLQTSAFAFSAQRSAQNLTVDGVSADCDKYNIDGSNYFKLRDLAQLLNGTGSQFDVGWDGAAGVVTVTTNHPYTTPNGHELEVGEDLSGTASVSSQTIMIDGVVRTDLSVYNIGGSNFFKLRELGDTLGFDVDFDSGTNTAIIQTRQTSQDLTGEVVIYSPENFVYKISREELEKYLKWGFSTEPQELVFSCKGEFGTEAGFGKNTVTTWQRSGHTLLINDQDSFAYAYANPAIFPKSQFSEKPELNSVFILRGSAGLFYDLIDAPTVTRVEIADTATKIDSSFEGSAITRLGVPSSVTSINLTGLKSNLVFYGEAGSFVEKVAKKNGFKFVASTILYDGYGRTVMVTPEERELFLDHGWYAEPVKKLYAADGRTKDVPVNRVAENVAVGWYENYEDVYVTMYALNGRTKEVLRNQIDEEKANGWYLYKDYLDEIDIKPSVTIAAVRPTKPNTVGGVEARIYWRNDSGKEIKYLHFYVTAYNGVGDKAKCEITGESSASLVITGPISNFDVDTLRNGEDSVFYFYLDDDLHDFKYVKDFKTKAPHVDYDTAIGGGSYHVEDYYLSDLELRNIYKKTEWDVLWYNYSIKKIVITSIWIEYMDGTEERIESPRVLHD